MQIVKTLLLCLMASSAGVTEAQQTEEDQGKSPHTMYLFGMAASFNDSTVCITPVEQVKGAWVSKKSKFLLGREEYSYQLRQYLADSMAMSHRTCITFFGKKKAKMEKQRQKMLALYTVGKKKNKKAARPPYHVVELDSTDFHFRAVDMGNVDDENDPKVIAERKAKAKQQKAERKAKKAAAKAAEKAAEKVAKWERKARRTAQKAARKEAERKAKSATSNTDNK